MLRINLEVTETSTRLKQIKEVIVVNRSEDPYQQVNVTYEVFKDGSPIPALVKHDRKDGAVALAIKALEAVEDWS